MSNKYKINSVSRNDDKVTSLIYDYMNGNQSVQVPLNLTGIGDNDMQSHLIVKMYRPAGNKPIRRLVIPSEAKKFFDQGHLDYYTRELLEQLPEASLTLTSRKDSVRLTHRVYTLKDRLIPPEESSNSSNLYELMKNQEDIYSPALKLVHVYPGYTLVEYTNGEKTIIDVRRNLLISKSENGDQCRTSFDPSKTDLLNFYLPNDDVHLEINNITPVREGVMTASVTAHGSQITDIHKTLGAILGPAYPFKSLDTLKGVIETVERLEESCLVSD